MRFADGRASKFIYASEMGGRYTSKRPAGVSPDQINAIDVPNPLPTELAAYFGIYLQLAADHVTDEDAGWMKFLMKASEALWDGYSDTFPSLSVAVAADPLVDAIAKGDNAVGLLAQNLQDTLSIYGDCGICARVASELCLMAEMLQKWCAVEPLANRRMLIRTYEMTRSFSSAKSQLALLVARSSSPTNLMAAIQVVAESMQEKGEEIQRIARGAPSLEQFYGTLYRSIPWLLGAVLAFEFLEGAAVPAPKSATISKNVCDELATLATTAMIVQFRNSLDNRDIVMRRKMAIERHQSKGASEAELLVDEWIETALSYPAIAKQFLLGTTESLIEG